MYYEEGGREGGRGSKNTARQPRTRVGRIASARERETHTHTQRNNRACELAKVDAASLRGAE